MASLNMMRHAPAPRASDLPPRAAPKYDVAYAQRPHALSSFAPSPGVGQQGRSEQGDLHHCTCNARLYSLRMFSPRVSQTVGRGRPLATLKLYRNLARDREQLAAVEISSKVSSGGGLVTASVLPEFGLAGRQIATPQFKPKLSARGSRVPSMTASKIHSCLSRWQPRAPGT